MLTEEQAAELLRRCEALAKRPLPQVRGNLRNSATRAAAVWELLVVDSVARLGPIEYESATGGPDVRLLMPSDRWVAVEIAYLYPRFWREEVRSRVVSRWLREHAANYLGPEQARRIGCSFYGDRAHPAGPVRLLPGEHERFQFLTDPEVVRFFQLARESPLSRHEVRHSRYTVTLVAEALGGASAPVGGGLVQEVPRDVREHAVFRVLRQKRRQHQLEGPRLVCIGSDVSPALSRLAGRIGPGVRQAIQAAFRASQALSGALVVQIENRFNMLGGGISTRADASLWLHDASRVPLSTDEVAFLQRLNFNHWKLSFSPLTPNDHEPNRFQRKSCGAVSLTLGISTMQVTIPVPTLVDVLSEEERPSKALGAEGHRLLMHHLRQGWVIVGSSFKAGDIERGEAPAVVFDLAPPHEAVFWPREGTPGESAA